MGADGVNQISLIIPYYNQKLMLEKHLEVIRDYPPGIKVIVVDDGSKIPATDVGKIILATNLSLYRINDDIPWNRSQARNLGAFVADTEWIIQTDIDHILPLMSAEELLLIINTLDTNRWYRFHRWRVCKADHTRNKDSLPRDQEFGKILPHMDSYLITREMFLSSPYDERYSGCLGGGSPFIARMTRVHGDPDMLSDEISLQVYTSSAVADASVDLDRDTSEYSKRRKIIEDSGDDKPPRMLCYPWHRVL